jgi:hypothetical protein
LQRQHVLDKRNDDSLIACVLKTLKVSIAKLLGSAAAEVAADHAGAN